MKNPTEPLAPASHFWLRYSISHTTWWRLSQTQGFPEPVRFDRAVRRSVVEVDAFIGGVMREC